MKYADLFPVTTRAFNLQEAAVPREEGTDPRWWGLLLLANVQAGDRLVVDDGDLLVERVEDGQVGVVWQGETLILTADNVRDSAAYTALVAWLARYAETGNPYADPLSVILERDPAVFRLRTGRGWVVNDRLMIMSGNITYPLDATDEPAEPVSVEATQSAPAVTAEGGQGAFDF